MESQGSAMDREEVLGVDGREARRRRLAMGRDAGASRDTNSASGAQKANKGKSAAEKMMEKMGWTKGRGLGKSEQGMTTPLEVRKDSATSGKIVNAAPVIFEKKKVPLRGKPTPVLLLRNVVLAGEVVDTLEDDVAEHCEKFGDVVRVFIFEIEEEGFAKEETVRIFVEFVDTKTAISAGAELDGRVFANRVVKASYYDVERFEAGDLGPQAGET
jgi:splicing factor 45